MIKITRAISIRQPYVELILRGEKRREYRGRPTHFRGRVYLYASLTPGLASYWKKIGKKPGDLPTYKIVGTVEIVDCRDAGDGYYAYILKNPKRLRTHLIPRNQPQPCFWLPVF
jgi:hypothetical protein